MSLDMLSYHVLRHIACIKTQDMCLMYLKTKGVCLMYLKTQDLYLMCLETNVLDTQSEKKTISKTP